MNLKKQLRDRLFGMVDPGEQFWWHFREGHKHYQNANAKLSIRHFRECLEISPENCFTLYTMSLVYLQVLGDVEEALRLLRYTRRLRERLCTPKGKLPCRFLDQMWVHQIGHIANMEHLIKREILLGRDPKNMILHFPESVKPANQFLLEKMGAYLTIVREEENLPYPQEMMRSALEEYFITESLDGLIKHWWHASPEIFRAWEEAGRAPLLTLSEEEMEKGRAGLRERGVPDDAWFVCLHVREGGFKKDQGFNSIDRILNAEIGTYLPAIRAVTERGGWVIRIGDPSMRALPPMPRVIDYADRPIKDEAMDVFLLAACRFFIGTSSGPAYVPPLFGTPCVLTNWVPTGQRPFNGRDLYITKLYRAGFPPRQLSFAEMMAPPIGYAPRYAYAEELGLSAAPNTPEEIREVVNEMLNRLDGTLFYSEMDEALQSAFDAVAETNLCIGNARLGRGFLRRNSYLLAGEGQHAL